MYRKVLIIGCGGAGKSTLAVALGKKLGIPVVHLDTLWWLPGWCERTEDEFDRLLEKELKKDSWVIEGNFRRTFAARLQYADFCVFLDYPRELCIKSVYSRLEKFKGRTRPDITEGCIERVSPEFEEWIKNFTENTRPVMLRTLIDSGVPHKIFTSRNQTDEWLQALP